MVDDLVGLVDGREQCHEGPGAVVGAGPLADLDRAGHRELHEERSAQHRLGIGRQGEPAAVVVEQEEEQVLGDQGLHAVDVARRRRRSRSPPSLGLTP